MYYVQHVRGVQQAPWYTQGCTVGYIHGVVWPPGVYPGYGRVVYTRIASPPYHPTHHGSLPSCTMAVYTPPCTMGIYASLHHGRYPGSLHHGRYPGSLHTVDNPAPCTLLITRHAPVVYPACSRCIPGMLPVYNPGLGECCPFITRVWENVARYMPV